MEQMSLVDWEEEKREVTTAELDALVKELKTANDEYDKQHAISTELFHKCARIEQRLVDLMTLANKSKYEVEGVALVTISHKASVTTPKTIEEKQKLFAFLEKKFGAEGLIAYQSVNSATLNSLYNKEMTEAQERGIDFEMGQALALPTVTKKLSVRSR